MKKILIFCLISSFLSAAKIIAIGDLIVDHTLYLPKETIKLYCHDLDSSEKTSKEVIDTILEGKEVHSHPGGSATNTLIALSELGHNCSLIGKLGNDALGQFHREKMAEYGVKIYYSLSQKSPTAEVLCLINEETKARSMLSSLGASLEMTPEEVNQSAFEAGDLLHIEGYSLYKMAVLEKTLRAAKRNNLKVSIDLASHTLVKAFKGPLLQILKEHAHIVFAHLDEAEALTGLKEPKEAALKIAEISKIAVVHMGEEGGFVASNKKVFKFDAIKVANCMDTTGAGDLFAAGFLHGYLENYNLKECAKMGAILGAAIVQVEGAQLPKNHSLLPLVHKN
jgi:sugar/nucleoside kinase (ribokinase family)